MSARNLSTYTSKKSLGTGGSLDRLVSRAWVNPYITELETHRGSIFCPWDREDDRDAIGEIAGSGKPIVLELGSGSGGNLISRAEQNPDKIFFGFELRFKRLVRSSEKAQERGLQNVFWLRSDARALDKLFVKESVSEVMLFFPEPWQKAKQKKHRLLTVELLQSIWNVLGTNGRFLFKTDHDEYFDYALEVSREVHNIFSLAESTRDYHSDTDTSEDEQKSEFESLFYSQGKSVKYMCLRKKA